MKPEEARAQAEAASRRTKVGGAVVCSVVMTLGAGSQPILASDAGQRGTSLGVTAIVVRPTIVSVERERDADNSVVVTSTDRAGVRVEGGSQRRLDRDRTFVTVGEGGTVVTLSY